MLEVTIVNSGKDIGRSSDSSDRLHARAMCLDLKCSMKTVGGTKDAVLSSRNTCLHHLLVRNLTVSAPDKVMGIQGIGSRTGRCPPLHELGNWHNSIPGLKTFFKSIGRVAGGPLHYSAFGSCCHVLPGLSLCHSFTNTGFPNGLLAFQLILTKSIVCMDGQVIFSISNQPSNHSRFT